jgi:biotin carboxylase
MNGETVGSATQTSAGQIATANVAGGPYVVTPSGATGGTFAPSNYAISYVNGALTVTPPPLTITAQDVTKVYGQTPALTGFSTSALMNGETVGSTTQTSTGQLATSSVAAGPYAVTPSSATGGTFAPANYAISYVNGALTVTPAPLTITAQDVTKVYGQTPALTGFSTSALMNGETVGSTTQTSTGQLATANVAGGPYAVMPSSATGGTFVPGNYAISYINGSLTVTPAPLTITAQDVTKVYGQTPALAGFSTSALMNGETVGSTTQTSTGQLATANVAGGPYVVTPSGATGGSFTASNYAISYVNGSLTVTPAPLTITAQDVTKIYGQTPALTGFSTSALMNGETVGSTTQTSTGQLATANVAGGPYVVTPSSATGGTFAPGNYAISYVNGALTVTPAPLTITAQDVTKVYGQTPTLTGFTTSPLVNDETVGSVTLNSTGQIASANVLDRPYAITPSHATGGTFTETNYAISYNNGALTVLPAEVVPPPTPPPVVDPTPDPSDTTPQRAIPAFSAAQALPEMPTTDTNPILLSVQPLAAIAQGPVIFPAAPVLMPEPTLAQVAPLPAPPLPILPVLAPKQDRN